MITNHFTLYFVKLFVQVLIQRQFRIRGLIENNY